jgi:3-deoxy-D-manno-octulosonic-acid transferase
MYGIYTVVLSAGLIAALPFYAARFGKYLPTLRERMGLGVAPGHARSIWIHAVSVGEVRAVDPLVARIRRAYPDRRIVLSTTTPSGRALASARPDVDLVMYFPFDLPGPIRRCLDKVRPEMVIIAETEIWPNFLRICARRGVPVFLVNGRISDRSLRRYVLAARWLPRVLDGFRLLAMQSETDAERIRSIGAPPERVVVLGNLKYDHPSAPGRIPESLRRVLNGPDAGNAPLIVAASTAEGEEVLVLEAFRQIRETVPGARLLLAPRRTERFDAVHRIVAERDLACFRRTGIGENTNWSGDVLLLDSIGELSGAFEFAAVVFMGGTLVPRGGHNILEPARFGRPILFGPHMENFRDIAQAFLGEGAGIEVAGPDALASEAVRVLTDQDLASRLGANALGVSEKNRGATERTLAAISRAMAGLSEGTAR